MFEYLIVAVSFLRKYSLKLQVPCRLFCQIYVSDLVGRVWPCG